MRRKDKEKDICPEEEFMIARMISEVLLGNLSEEDAVYLEKWKLASEEHMELYKAIMDEENRKRLEKEFSFFDKNAGWGEFLSEEEIEKTAENAVRFDEICGDNRHSARNRILYVEDGDISSAFCFVFFALRSSGDAKSRFDFVRRGGRRFGCRRHVDYKG